MEADVALTAKEALQVIEKNTYEVLAVPLLQILSKDFEKVLDALKKKSPSAQILVMAPVDSRTEELKTCLEKFPIFRFTAALGSADFEKDVVFALEEAQMKKQEIQMENLVREQNQKLRELYQELEDRVEKRQRFLLEARRKNFIAHTRWESLREAMLAIHQALSLGEMEKNLLTALQPTMDLQMIRILLKPQDEHFARFHQDAQLSTFQAPLFRHQEHLGVVVFLREAQRPFHRDETDFLLRIAETVSLAIDRLTKLEQSENLKEQWQATFNAISDPVTLINDNYDIIQSNQSQKFVGQKCYRALFQREAPCTHCVLGKSFRLDAIKGTGQIWEVHSQKASVDPLENHVYINLYHDVTEQIRMERKILDSARLAEIGTIGSSIAHELNNPLGGILSFVQLIKMDLKSSDSLYQDIQSMEDGVRRCKDIVQNLLGFTRDPMVDEEKDLDLRDVIDRAVKIVELQTKSRGIELKVILPSEPCLFRGHLNLLSQALRNVLQASIDALITKALPQGFIEVRLDNKPQEFQISILDNSLGSESTSSLGLSVAGQIVHDYGGFLEISSQSRPFRVAKISLPRPVFPA
jgi:nitrogen-specific signal transduction histidine kinase